VSQEREGLLQIAFHEGTADKNFGGFIGINSPIRNRPTRHNHQSEKADLFIGNYFAAIPAPVWLDIG
jgi:hypothetical protein